METIKLVVEVTAATAVRAGSVLAGKTTVALSPEVLAGLTESEREEFARIMVRSEGGYRLRLTFGESALELPSADTSPSAVVAALRQAITRVVKSRQEDEALAASRAAEEAQKAKAAAEAILKHEPTDLSYVSSMLTSAEGLVRAHPELAPWIANARKAAAAALMAAEEKTPFSILTTSGQIRFDRDARSVFGLKPIHFAQELAEWLREWGPRREREAHEQWEREKQENAAAVARAEAAKKALLAWASARSPEHIGVGVAEGYDMTEAADSLLDTDIKSVLSGTAGVAPEQIVLVGDNDELVVRPSPWPGGLALAAKLREAVKGLALPEGFAVVVGKVSRHSTACECDRAPCNHRDRMIRTTVVPVTVTGSHFNDYTFCVPTGS